MPITIVSFLIVFLLFILVIEAVRRGILETKYAILWLLTCIVLGILSLSEGLLEYLANLVGISYAPSLLFLFGLLCVLVLIFDITRRISGLSNKIVVLTQELALLREKYEQDIEQLQQDRNQHD